MTLPLFLEFTIPLPKIITPCPSGITTATNTTILPSGSIKPVASGINPVVRSIKRQFFAIACETPIMAVLALICRCTGGYAYVLEVELRIFTSYMPL